MSAEADDYRHSLTFDPLEALEELSVYIDRGLGRSSQSLYSGMAISESEGQAGSLPGGLSLGEGYHEDFVAAIDYY